MKFNKILSKNLTQQYENSWRYNKYKKITNAGSYQNNEETYI